MTIKRKNRKVEYGQKKKNKELSALIRKVTENQSSNGEEDEGLVMAKDQNT